MGREGAGKRLAGVPLVAVAAAAVLLAIALLITDARATSNTVIGFDDLQPGAPVANQYQAQGVELGTASGFQQASPGAGDCGSPTVQAGPGSALSQPNFAQLASCQVTVGAAQYYAGTYGSLLAYPRGTVSAEVMENSGTGGSVPMTITGYDSSGAAVATGTATAVGGSWALLAANQPAGSGGAAIRYFEITTTSSSGSPPHIAIDNLSFDQAGAPLSAAGTQVSATAGSLFSGPVATISDGDATAVSSDFTATIGWGDGASSAGTVAAAGSGKFTVSGSHTWQSAGSYPVHVAISKVNGRTASADTTATVGGSPSALLGLSTPNPVAGQVITLTGAGSKPGRGGIISYDWDFNGDGHTDTSTGANPIAHFIFAPGVHTVGLTVTNSAGQSSHTTLTLTVTKASPPPPTDAGGQGPCLPTYDNGNVHVIADCIQTLAGGGYVIQTRVLDLNGMMLVPRSGPYGTFRIRQVNQLGIGGGLQLSGAAVNVELFNTPIGDMTLGGIDLTSSPAWLSFTAYHPQTFHFAGGSRPQASVADSESKGTLLMSFGVGKNCNSGDKSPTCCPTGSNAQCAQLPGGFPLSGQVNVYLNDKGRAQIDVQVGLDLTAVNFQATGALEIVSDAQSGLDLSSLQFAIPQAGLANIFQVKDASFTYYFPSNPDPDKRDSWQAKATIIFGPLDQPSLQGELDFKQGQFQKASMTFTVPPCCGIPIYPGIQLNQLSATVGANPFQFGGGLGASIATQLELSLQFLYRDATTTTLGFFGGQGKLSFKGDDIATLAADVYSDGYTDAAIDIDLHFPFDSSDPVVKVTGHIGFWDEPASGRWEADGSVGLKLWIINAQVAGLVNNQYVAGCAAINGFGGQGRYRFSDGNIDGGLFAFSNCSDQLKPYKEQPLTPHTGGFVGSAPDVRGRLGVTAADTRGGGTITLPGGTEGQELLITSATGTPVVNIYGPGHRLYTTPSSPGQVSTSGGDFISAIGPDPHQVIVLLRHPQGGTYNIQPTATSAPITKVASAQDVPPAKIKVAVRRPGRGRAWTLSYRISNYVPGTQVQFVERGRDSTRVLGTAHVARGSIRFVPQDAIARHRAIVAYLRTASGAPLRTVTVGSYTAPAALRAGPVPKVRFVRGAGTATLSWGAARAARRYYVVVHGSDGRVVSAFAPAGQRRLTLTAVLPEERFTATVVAQGGPNLLPGPRRTVVLSPAGTGSVELLSCAAGRCRGHVVAGNLVSAGGEIVAALSRGGRTVATGIAGDLRRPAQLALTVRRALSSGSYGLLLTYRRGGQTHRVHKTITIR